MTLAIVIPTYGRTASVARLLQSIARQDAAPDEVLVIDQNAPGVLDALLTESGVDTLVHVRLAGPNGAAARNAGFTLSKSTHVVFVDDDEILDPDFIAHVKEVFATNAQVRCLWPVVYEGKRPEASRGSHAATLVPVNRAGAGGIAFERELFRSTGGYDETLFDFGRMSEDHELAMRMRQRRLTIWRDRSLFIRHDPALDGGCGIRSAPYHDTRERLLRVLLATLRLRSGAPFRLRVGDVWKIIRIGLLSSLGRVGGRMAVLRQPLWHLRALLGAISESRNFVQRHAARYSNAMSVDHLAEPTYDIVSIKALDARRPKTDRPPADAESSSPPASERQPRQGAAR